MKTTWLNSPEETLSFGAELGRSLKEGQILCFTGDLAAGKTTLIKGIVSGYMNYSPDLVSSPTFVYLNIYESDKTVCHFDFYRLGCPEEFLAMGFDEMLFSGALCCIEWPERVKPCLPDSVLWVHLEPAYENTRKITLS